MSNINFLENKKNDSKKRSNKNERRKIEWTKPVKDEPSRAKVSEGKLSPVKAVNKTVKDKAVFLNDSEKKFGKFNFFGWFSFFKKKKKNNNEFTNQKQFKHSGQEALKSVNELEKNESAASRKNESHGFLLWKKKSPPVEKILEKPAKKQVVRELDIKNNEKKSNIIPAKAVIKENKIKWEKAEILETNLIKGELVSFFNWKKGILILAVYVILSVLVIAAFYAGLSLWEKQIEQNKSEDSSRIRDLDKQVIKPLEKDARNILEEQERAQLAGNLLRKHIYWTNFFKFLEDNTLSEVYYTSNFSGDTKGKYSFPARAKNFKTILNQVTVMRMNDDVKEATVNGGSVRPANKNEQQEGNGKGGIGGVDFKLELAINPKLFTK